MLNPNYFFPFLLCFPISLFIWNTSEASMRWTKKNMAVVEETHTSKILEAARNFEMSLITRVWNFLFKWVFFWKPQWTHEIRAVWINCKERLMPALDLSGMSGIDWLILEIWECKVLTLTASNNCTKMSWRIVWIGRPIPRIWAIPRTREKKNKILQQKDKSDWNNDMVKGCHRDRKNQNKI